MLAHGLTDPALHELAEVVHEADVDDDQFHTLEAAGLDAVIRGLGMVARDDLELFETTHRLFDGLYAWFSRGTT